MIDRPRAEWWRPDSEVECGHRSAPIDAAKPQLSESALPFWALITFTFISFIAPQTFFPALAPLRIALLTGGFAIAAHLFDTFISRRRISLSPEIRIAACLVAWAIVTVPLSYWPGGSVSFLLDVYLKSAAIFWLLSEVVTTVQRLRQVAWALTLITVPMAVTALDNFLSGTFIRGTPRIVGYDAPMTGNPNGLALVLCLILPLSLALFCMARRTLVRAALLAIITLDVIAVVVTFSRGGFVTLAAVIVMYLWRLRNRPERRLAWAALVVAVACLPLLPSGYVDRLSTIASIESDPTGSAQARWRDTVAAALYVVAHPIVGAGIGQNVFALNEERGTTWLAVHNIYLLYGMELGIPGLLLFVLLVVRCIHNAWLVQQRSAPVPAFRDLFYLAEAIQTSLVVFAVGAFFHTNAYELHFYYFAGLAVAIKAAYDAKSGSDSVPRTPLPTPRMSGR